MTDNKEEYIDCFISSEDYYRMMELPQFLTIAYYPRVDFAILGEVGKISLGNFRFLRFFLKLDSFTRNYK